ncbi:MAG: hypothetical protein OIN88_03330 [Candidatus Methanoperedens sp.]|nr:hypothetical protein [Candidatus Methanoperedens sp.]MCZ7358848.1 hypothetical protein [Candidatus Methanoperedens sp.]HLB69738.1 hypothetical protein [Candidatus Methanoperedens sp.]
MIIAQLLKSIMDTQAAVVIIDITGVPTTDAAIANHLIRGSNGKSNKLF